MVTRVPWELGRSWPLLEECRTGSNRHSKLRDDLLVYVSGTSGDEWQALQGIAKRRKRSAAKRLPGDRSAS